MCKWIWLGLILVIACFLTGCVPGLPDKAWQAAVSAVCSSPLVPGQNLCHSVRFTGYANLPREKKHFPGLKHTHEYCVVLDYVDFTGETGTAWVRISGPDDEGEYLAQGGPLFNQPCAKK